MKYKSFWSSSPHLANFTVRTSVNVDTHVCSMQCTAEFVVRAQGPWDRLPISKSNNQDRRQQTLGLDNKTSAVACLLCQYLVQNGNYKNNLGGKNGKIWPILLNLFFKTSCNICNSFQTLRGSRLLMFFFRKYKGSYRFSGLKTHLLCISKVWGQ